MLSKEIESEATRSKKPQTDLVFKNAKPDKVNKKTRRISDSGGLYLEVAPNGSKYWRLKYRLHGKESRLSVPAKTGAVFIALVKYHSN